MNAEVSKTPVNRPCRAEHSYTQSIRATPAEVFPLLCPVRELDWAPGWQPDWVISESGIAEEGCVFQTPGEEDTPCATWVITAYRPADHHIGMIKIIPGHTVTKLEASLAADGRGGTHATITYGFTALGPQGERFVETRTAEWYGEFMQGWESAMNHYLETGQKA